MIDVNVLSEWHRLDTLNGYYRLDDLFKGVGKPEGKTPRDFLREACTPEDKSIRVNKYVWGNQNQAYAYAAYLCDDFRAHMEEALDLKDVRIMRKFATGVMHK